MTLHERPARHSEKVGFDAFISYARGDEAIAAEFQRALARFAKSWYRLRALRIFRDRAVLTTGPRLRETLHDGLRLSRSLILLASPAAAASEWVDEEVRFWRTAKPSGTVFLLVVEGRIGWDPVRGDFAPGRTDCLPPAAYGLFREEPSWGDLRGIGIEELRASPRFVDAVVDVAAPLHGRSKDEMFGEDVRQHRRVRQIVTGTVAVLAVITAFAVTAAIVAVHQRNTAERRAAIAESRELAMRATNTYSSDPHAGSELAVRAVRRYKTAEAVEALRTGLGLNHQRAALRSARGAMSAVAISSDGSEVAAGSEGGEVRLWRPGERGQGRRLLTRPSAVTALGFAPVGRRLVIGDGGGGVVLVDVRTGAAIELRGHTAGPVRTAEFNPDGSRVLTTSDDETARLWDGRTGRLLGSFRDSAAYLDAPHFSRRRGLFVTRTDDQAVVRTVRSGTQVAALDHGAAVAAATFSPDGTRLVTGGFDDTAKLWDVRSGRRIASLAGHREAVRSVAFSPDGSLVATAAHATRVDSDFTARVWAADDGRPVATLRGHTAAIRRVTFLDGVRVLTASYDGTARIWEARTGEQRESLIGHGQTLWDAVSDSAGRTVATAGQDGTVRVWDAGAGEPQLTVPLLNASDAGVLGGGLLAVVADREARIVRLSDGRTVSSLRLPGTHGPLLRVAPDGRRVGIDANGFVTSYDRGRGRWGPSITAEENFYSLDACNRDVSRTLVLRPRPAAPQIRGLTGRRTAVTLRMPLTTWVTSVAFSPDDRYLALATTDGVLRVFDTGTGAELRRLTLADKAFTMVFSPDSAALAVGGGSDLENNSRNTDGRLYDVPSGRLRATFKGHTQAIRAMSFSPDGRALVTAAQDDTARIWDARTGRELHELRGHTGEVWAAEFSPNGEFVVTAGGDRTARVWRVSTGQPVAVLRGPGDSVGSVHFDGGGTRVVATSSDGVRVFASDLFGDADALLAAARRQGVE
ncbi:TIR domain-containing protein [Actinomadura sp. NPDC000600]|uniref:WD40 repeat domain-containing protein n=1 Tax=Actinomadura sp. NPDC000600 TaxID=3154262 RepID=UPI0033984B1C